MLYDQPTASVLDKQVKLRHSISKRLGDFVIYQMENFNGQYDFRSAFHKGWEIASHLHEYSEILYCQKGRCTIEVNGKTVDMEEGEFMWLPPNYIHRYPKTDAHLVCAVFSNDYIPLFFHLSGNRRMVVQGVAAGELAQLLERLPELAGENPLKICGYLHLICEKVVKNADFEDVGQADGILCQKLISYVAAHFKEDISQKQIAREFGYNEKYLSHTIHEVLGIHFSKLLALYRVEHAKKLLNRNNQSISCVAASSGFGAVNTFNRVFKEMTGVTPSEYRSMQVLSQRK